MTTVWLVAVVLALSGGAAIADEDDKFVAGESATVAGGTMSTWARVNGAGKVIWVGTTMPLSVVENQPAPGTGPSGAIAVLNYPAVVQQTTYFNHTEIHSQNHGHGTGPGYANPNRYMAPHFDFHFYSIPLERVMTIPFLPPVPPLPNVPGDRIPEGYSQPGFSVIQMGRHSWPLSEFTATDTWQLTMFAGFLPHAQYSLFGEPWMHFLEPMITSEFLLRRENFTLPVPKPAVLGRATQYATEFVAHYDRELDAYHFVFKGLEPIE